MEILPNQPQNLILEARHTLSLEVSKKRRLAVGSSLFLPRKLIRKMLPTSRYKTRNTKDSPANPPTRKRNTSNEELQIHPIVNQKPKLQSKEDPKLQSREEPTLQAKETNKLQSNPESNRHHNMPSGSPPNTRATQNMNTQKDSSEPSDKPGSTTNLFGQKDVLDAGGNPSSKTKKASGLSSGSPGCSCEPPICGKPEGFTTNLFGQKEASEACDNPSCKTSVPKRDSDRSNRNQCSAHERSISPNINVEEQAPEGNCYSHTKQHHPSRQNCEQLPFDIIVQRNGSVRILHDEDIEVDLDVQTQRPPVKNIFEMRNRNRQHFPTSASYGGDPRYFRQPMAEFYPVPVPFYQGPYGNQYPPLYYQRATSSDHYFSPAIHYQQHYEHMTPYYPLMHRQIPSQQSQYAQNCYPNIEAQRQNKHVQHFYINLQSSPFPNQSAQSNYPPPQDQQNQRAQNIHSNVQPPPPHNQHIPHSYSNTMSPPSPSQHDQNNYPPPQENQYVQDFHSNIQPSTAKNQPVQNSHPNIQSTPPPNQYAQCSHPIIQAVPISKLLQPEHLGSNQSGQTSQSHNQPAYFKTQQPQVPMCDEIGGLNTQPTLDQRAYQQLNLPRMPTQNQSVPQNITEQQHIHQLGYQQPQMQPHSQSLLQHTLNQQQKLPHIPNHLQEEIQREHIRNMIRSLHENESPQGKNASKQKTGKAQKPKQTKQQETHPIQFQPDLRNPDSTTNENATTPMVNIPGGTTLSRNFSAHPLLGDMADILEQRRLFEFHQSIAKRSNNQRE